MKLAGKMADPLMPWPCAAGDFPAILQVIAEKCENVMLVFLGGVQWFQKHRQADPD
jgi:hypothetical protein